MKTLKFSITVGINESYYEGFIIDNEFSLTPAKIVAEKWEKAALIVYSDLGIYIPGIIKNSISVYHTEWGCPSGGESTATIEGAMNPKFNKDIDDWSDAVVAVATILKEELLRSSISIEFQDVSELIVLKTE